MDGWRYTPLGGPTFRWWRRLVRALAAAWVLRDRLRAVSLLPVDLEEVTQLAEQYLGLVGERGVQEEQARPADRRAAAAGADPTRSRPN